MRHFLLTSILLFVIFLVQGQAWKDHYDQAVSDYQLHHYPEAMINAEKAYSDAKTLEVKNQTFSLQLLTAICLETQDYDKGLEYSKEEVKLFGETEGTKSKRYAEALSKRAQMFQAISNWPDARKDYEELSALYSATPGQGSAEYLRALNNYGQVLLSMNELSKASEVLGKVVTGLKQLPDEEEEYLSALYFAAYVDNKNKNISRAESRLQEFISLADKKKLQSWPEYAEAKAQLVQLADARGNRTEALALVQQGDVAGELKAREYLKAAIESQNPRPAEALDYFKRAEESLAKSGMETNTGFSIVQNYARYLYTNKQLKEAQAKLEQARQIALKLYSSSSIEFGYVLELDADLKMTSGNVKGADESYALAFRNFLTLPPATQAAHRVNAAVNFLNVNRPDVTRKILETMTSNYAFLFALPEKIQLEVTLVDTEALIQLNLTEIAVNHLLRHQTNNISPTAQNTIALKLAEVYKSAGDWKKSEVLLDSVVKKTGGLPQLQAEASYQLARLHQQMGQYKEAEISYQKAIAGYKKLNSTELTQVYNSFATFYITLGNYSAAETIYKNLLNDPQTSEVLISAVKQNLATIYQQTLRFDEAERLFNEVLETDRKTIGEKHPDFAISLQNLAALYQMKGNFEKAKGLYVQALDIDKQNGGDQTLSYANKAANLGTIYQETGQPQKARLLLESTLKIRERILGKDHPDFMFNVYSLAVLQQGLGEFAAAAPLFKQVSGFYLKQIKEIFPSLSDYEKTSYLNKINKVIDDYEEFVILHQPSDNTALGELYNFRLETKALLLNASTKVRNTILASGNPALLTKFTEWLQLKEKLARYASLTLEEKESQQKIIEENQQKANELEKWLSEQSELFGPEFSKQPITWQEVKKALKPGEAAIEMIRLSPEKDAVVYAALVIGPGQAAPGLVTFANGNNMEGREFSFYSNSIRFDLDNTRSYALFWQPLESFLQNVTTIYFSADGVYNKINPLTLYDKERNGYLIDRYTIRLLSNLREVTSSPGSLSTTPSASLFGFPDFRSGQAVHSQKVATSTRNMALVEIMQNGVSDLPGTKEEVISIEQLLKKNQWSVHTYMNKEASEEHIKTIQSPDVLHIATHGFFIPEKEDETTIVYSTDISLALDNPLTRSGLLLAGVEKNLTSEPTTTEDGILTALEVMNLSLDHTDLVILSACETGSGKIRNGEGVYGLQRAFLVSGANNLIMSLWKVSDEATQELMTGFYSQFLVSKDKVTAFHQAQLELKKKYETPFFWGAFVLIGR